MPFETKGDLLLFKAGVDNAIEARGFGWFFVIVGATAFAVNWLVGVAILAFAAWLMMWPQRYWAYDVADRAFLSAQKRPFQPPALVEVVSIADIRSIGINLVDGYYAVILRLGDDSERVLLKEPSYYEADIISGKIATMTRRPRVDRIVSGEPITVAENTHDAVEIGAPGPSRVIREGHCLIIRFPWNEAFARIAPRIGFGAIALIGIAYGFNLVRADANASQIWPHIIAVLAVWGTFLSFFSRVKIRVVFDVKERTISIDYMQNRQPISLVTDFGEVEALTLCEVSDEGPNSYSPKVILKNGRTFEIGNSGTFFDWDGPLNQIVAATGLRRRDTRL